MCLHIDELKYKKAEDNILCYKILEEDPETNRLISPFQDFEYIVGKLYQQPKTPFKLYEDPLYYYGKGLGRYIIAKGGFHSFVNKKSVSSVRIAIPYPFYCATCVIPKGTIYVEGKDDFGRPNYVSKRITVVSIERIN